MRDSELIRKLIKSGLSYRAISAIAKCSHGSVSAEVAAWKREQEAERKKKLEEESKAQEAARPQNQGTIFPEMPKEPEKT